MLQGERTTPMSMTSKDKQVSGMFFVNGYVLPTLSDDDAYYTMASTINFNDILLSGKGFNYVIDDVIIKRNEDNIFVSIKYYLYFPNHFNCPLNEYLDKEYFENYYDDMDIEFKYGDKVPLLGMDFIQVVFEKDKTGWRRIE
jgi:hypothetical protein